MPYWCAGVLTLGLAAWSPVTGLRIPGKLGKRSWVGTRGFEQEGDKPTRKPGSNTVGQLVLLRHGVTAWDRTSTFTGWADPDIDDCGALEAKSAALALKESGFSFDIAYTSVLKRSIHTTWLLLKELGQVATPIYKSWRLNERSLGSLTGHTVEESIAEHGAEAVGSWRRSLDARPPPYEADHPFHPAADLKYYKWQDRSGEVSPIRPPGCESLRDAIRRALPVWYDEILPALCEGNNVLVVAHGNSLRAVLSAIEQLDDEQIAQLEIPSAIPLVYRFRDPDAPGRVKRGLSRFRREIGRLGAAAASTLPGLSSLQGRDDSVADGSYATPVGAELSEARGLPGLGLTYAAERDLRLEPLPVPCALAPLSGEWLAENEAVLQAQERARAASLQRYGLQVTPRTQRGDDLGEEPSAGARPAALPGLEGNVAADPCYATEECSTTREAAGCGEVIECPAEGEDFEYFPQPAALPGLALPGLEVNTAASALRKGVAPGGTLRGAGSSAGSSAGSGLLVAAQWWQRRPPQPPPPTAQHVVIIRHGKTVHNKLGLFTGWEDAPLAMEGRGEATAAGQMLRRHGFTFDVVYTSWLERAIETAWLVLTELDEIWLPVHKSWRLNERMYGSLTGLSKKRTKAQYGAEMFMKWRRSYHTRPPSVDSFSPLYPGNDERYVRYVQDLPISLRETLVRSIARGRPSLHRKLPRTESLRDCMARTIPYWTNSIEKRAISKGKSVLIASSENAIRGLLMHLLGIEPTRISEVEIPTGLPLVVDLELGKLRLLEGTPADYNFGKSGAELLFDEMPVAASPERNI